MKNRSNTHSFEVTSVGGNGNGGANSSALLDETIQSTGTQASTTPTAGGHHNQTLMETGNGGRQNQGNSQNFSSASSNINLLPILEAGGLVCNKGEVKGPENGGKVPGNGNGGKVPGNGNGGKSHQLEDAEAGPSRRAIFSLSGSDSAFGSPENKGENYPARPLRPCHLFFPSSSTEDENHDQQGAGDRSQSHYSLLGASPTRQHLRICLLTLTYIF
jgi:hypothetical protein